jgi:enamine deaminase RidA (YjgF/YER057c/UK114 family)
MSTRHVQPTTVHPTVGYTHAVVTEGALVHVSGQVAFDRDRKLVGPGDIAAQAEQTYANLKAVLEAAGSGLERVVKMVVYITDPRFVEAVRAARGKYLSEPYPASTLVVVSGLAAPEFLVEIEATATIG